MKVLVLIGLLISTNIFASQSYNLVLQNDLATLVLEKENITTSDGEISHMLCSPYYDGIACNIEFTFFDENDIYRCTELYTYRGGEEYWIQDSDCWFRRL